MDSQTLRRARKRLNLTQGKAAARLGVSQPYLSLLEKGARKIPARLAKKVVSAFRMSATNLPLEDRPERHYGDLAGQLAALGYPGFKHLRGAWRRNPATVLLSALADERLEARLFEALPWLLLSYSDMDRDYLLEMARLKNLSNRLGFVVALARAACRLKGEADSQVYRNLDLLEKELQTSRLDREDQLFGQTSASPKELDWLRRNRSPEAKYWHVLTDWKAEHLQYV
jgi:transcriptional regulator with XRE-family HTH domain